MNKKSLWFNKNRAIIFPTNVESNKAQKLAIEAPVLALLLQQWNTTK